MGEWQEGLSGVARHRRSADGVIVGTVGKQQLGYDWGGKGTNSKAKVQSLQMRPSLISPCVQDENITTC